MHVRNVREASTFNGNIGAWNTAQVTNFNGMLKQNNSIKILVDGTLQTSSVWPGCFTRRAYFSRTFRLGTVAR